MPEWSPSNRDLACRVGSNGGGCSVRSYRTVRSNKFLRVHQSVRNHVLPLKPHKLLPQDHDNMMDKITQRELLNANKEMNDESIDDSDEEDSISSNDDSDVDEE